MTCRLGRRETSSKLEPREAGAFLIVIANPRGERNSQWKLFALFPTSYRSIDDDPFCTISEAYSVTTQHENYLPDSV